jgi:hypothetical protein
MSIKLPGSGISSISLLEFSCSFLRKDLPDENKWTEEFAESLLAK